MDAVNYDQNLNNAIFARPFNQKDALPQKLTCNQFNIKSNFHGYGGKSYKCLKFRGQLYLIWIDQLSKAIWFQVFDVGDKKDINEQKYLVSIQEPRQLSNQ